MRPVLITCGGTRNPVDAIRYLSAGATGTTATDPTFEAADSQQGRSQLRQNACGAAWAMTLWSATPATICSSVATALTCCKVATAPIFI